MWSFYHFNWTYKLRKWMLSLPTRITTPSMANFWLSPKCYKLHVFSLQSRADSFARHYRFVQNGTVWLIGEHRHGVLCGMMIGRQSGVKIHEMAGIASLSLAQPRIALSPAASTSFIILFCFNVVCEASIISIECTSKESSIYIHWEDLVWLTCQGMNANPTL